MSMTKRIATASENEESSSLSLAHAAVNRKGKAKRNRKAAFYSSADYGGVGGNRTRDQRGKRKGFARTQKQRIC